MKKNYIIAKQLKLLLKAHKMTPKELKERVGFSHSMIWKWLHRKPASYRSIKKIAVIFGTTPFKIYKPDNTPSKSCGMKRALEIIGEDYLRNNEHLAVHSPQPPVPHISNTGEYVQ